MEIFNNKEIIETVMDKSNHFRDIKMIHASGHGGQHINHGNSKAQLHFDINKFYDLIQDENNKSRDKFVETFGQKKIHRNNSSVVLENQETRYALKNKENVLEHLKQLLIKFLDQNLENLEIQN